LLLLLLLLLLGVGGWGGVLGEEGRRPRSFCNAAATQARNSTPPHLLGVKGAILARDALADDLGVLVDEDGRRL